MKLKFTVSQYFFLMQKGLFPFNIFTHMTGDELLKLHYLSKSLTEKAIFIEIGSYLGASSVFIASGLNESSNLFCVDTWENDAMSEGKRDTFSQFKHNTIKYSTKIRPIRKTSVDAAKSFDFPVDAVFFDGDHSYEGIKADIDAWFPKIKKNGLVILHDSGWAQGVQRVIEEDLHTILINKEHLPNMFWGWVK